MNRNIAIITEHSSPVEGYQNVLIGNIDAVTNGYINDIVCECLDLVEIQDRTLLLQKILTKMSFEGSATFKFINATVLANRILRNEIESEKISHIIKNTRSLWTDSVISQIFGSIPNTAIEKNYTENIYSIISIRKGL